MPFFQVCRPSSSRFPPTEPAETEDYSEEAELYLKRRPGDEEEGFSFFN